MDRTGIFTASFDRAREGALDLRRGGSHVAIRAAQSDFCRAGFDGPAPKASAEDGRVTIEFPRFSLAGLPAWVAARPAAGGRGNQARLRRRALRGDRR
jgi:hypothetical protein